MSSMKTIEKRPFEDLLQMSSGYVLDFTNDTFEALFVESVNISIYDDKYVKYGGSKAKRLRAFWELESDAVVGKVLVDLIDNWEYKYSAAKRRTERFGLEGAEGLPLDWQTLVMIIRRMVVDGMKMDSSSKNLEMLHCKMSQLMPRCSHILDARYQEARRNAWAAFIAPLAAVFMCGSVLEGLLLGTARANPQQFNNAAGSPKDQSGKTKPFSNWSLAQLKSTSHAGSRTSKSRC